MSKPDKIPIETKKCTCYYGIAASSKVRVGSYGSKKICCWLGRQIKIEKAKKTEKAKRQRRQAKTEKAKRQRRQAGSYRTENRSGIRQVGTLDCYGTCQRSALLNGVFVQWSGFHIRVVSFLRINIPLFEPYHGRTVEQLDAFLLAVDL